MGSKLIPKLIIRGRFGRPIILIPGPTWFPWNMVNHPTNPVAKVLN